MTAYPVAGKLKCLHICEAFVQGCGGKVSNVLRPGPAFFFGINASNVAIWREVIRDGRAFFYGDNSHFDSRRQRYFRVTKNRLQIDGSGSSDGKRAQDVIGQIRPWRNESERILMCPQSDDFMRFVINGKTDWMARTKTAIGQLTPIPVRLRPWQRDKGHAAAGLKADLVGVHAVVTWSSAAAVMALMFGVPAVVLGQCAAEAVATPLAEIAKPRRPDREEWVAVLADNEWAVDELKSGMAWERLNG